MRPLLHVAAFWVDGDHGDEIADYLKELKIDGTRGAVVTFSLDTAWSYDFRQTMRNLDLADVHEAMPLEPSDLTPSPPTP